MGETYNLEVIAKNVRNILDELGLENGSAVDRAKEKDGRDILYNLPSHNTIDRLLRGDIKNPKAGSLKSFVQVYNELFQTSYKLDDFVSRELPCKVEYAVRVPKLYEGLYYGYAKRVSRNGIAWKTLLYLYVEENAYKVRALLNIDHEETLKNKALQKFLLDPSKRFADLQKLQDELPDNENYYLFFDGTMDILNDFCRINLTRPEDYPFQTSKHEVSIYIRRVAEDMRKNLHGAIGVMIMTTYTRDLFASTFVLSDQLLETDMVNQYLGTDALKIRDKEDFGLYKYLTGEE